MSAPNIHGNFRSVPASKLLDALGRSLADIKEEDGLTLADLGAELGKHEDTASAYVSGRADMPATVLLRAISRWDGRFINRALALVGGKYVALEPCAGSDRCAASKLTKLLLEMSVALEDGRIDDHELANMREAIEAASSHIDRMRELLRVRAA